MKRWQTFFGMMILSLALIGLVSDSVAQTNRRCGLVLARGGLTLDPVDAVLLPGETIDVGFSARAVVGNWRISANLLNETLVFDRQGDLTWEINEGQELDLNFQVKVLEASEAGVYPMTFAATALALNNSCDAPITANKSDRFDLVVVDFANTFDVQDSVNDFFDRASGEAVLMDDVNGIDIVTLNATRSETELVFNFNMQGVLPEIVLDEPRQVGCYLDTDGDASFSTPFNATGFEFFALNTWEPGNPFATLVNTANLNDTILGIDSNVDRNTLTMRLNLELLGSPDDVQWVCFSQYEAFNGDELVDLAPNSGLGTL